MNGDLKMVLIMRWFKKNPPTADVSMLRVELMKAQMTINDLQCQIIELKEDNSILKGRIVRFLDGVQVSSDDMWDALEILRGQR